METAPDIAQHDDAHPSPRPAFALASFAPGWGASVMGTAALVVVFTALANHGVLPGVTRVMSVSVFWVAVAVGVLVIGTTLARWVRHPRAAWADLGHPVKGGMSATLPGAFLVLAVAVGRVAPAGIPSWPIVAGLAALGGILALVFGWVFLSGVLARGATPPGLITGAWFIPPVVVIIMPTALAPFIGNASVGLPDALSRELLGLSWVMMGIGTALFLAITAVLIWRSATAPLPPAQLAPTLTIGLGPAGLIGLNLILMAQAADRLGLMGGDAVGLASMVGGMFWGFGGWWAVTSLLVMLRGYAKVPFALSWWGFTFPLAAWTIAGITISGVVGSGLLLGVSVLGAVVLSVVWVYTLVRTIRGVIAGTIWEP